MTGFAKTISCILLLSFLQYHNTKGEHRTLCDKNTLDITCRKGRFIIIEEASYGRTDSKTCGQNSNIDCELPSTLATLQNHCFGAPTCNTVIGSNNKGMFPDPCPGVPKYLDLVYNCVQRSEVFQMCDQYTIDAKSGYIKSPNYPFEYDKNIDCELQVKVPEGYGTQVELIDLELEARKTQGCYDWLILKEEDDPSDTHDYCGDMQTMKSPMEVFNNKLVIKLKTDGMHHYRGFLLKFTVKESTKEVVPHKPQRKQAPPPMHPRGPQAYEDEDDKEEDKVVERSHEEPNYNYVKDDELAEQEYDERGARPPIPGPVKKKSKPARKKERVEQGVGCSKETIPLSKHSKVLSMKQGKQVRLGCEEGYTLLDDEDSFTLLCHDSKWIGSSEECLPVYCADPPNILNGRIVKHNSQVKRLVVEYGCEPGYRLEGIRSRDCMTNGDWSGEEPVCIAVHKRRLTMKAELMLAVILTLVVIYLKNKCKNFRGLRFPSFKSLASISIWANIKKL